MSYVVIGYMRIGNTLNKYMQHDGDFFMKIKMLHDMMFIFGEFFDWETL